MPKGFPAYALALSLSALMSCPVRPARAQSELPEPPPVMHEFRAAWVATVANIDWPSRPGLSTDRQKSQLVEIMDRAVKAHLNAIVFQVRPACDALYESKIEPWSEYLTGKQGRAPEPYYDPLAFAVDEAHKRGLELHAWFNPYRAHHADSRGEIAPSHVSKQHPELVRKYGRYLWLDPGDRAVQDYSIRVITDVVRRYDIDGVHIDDYFYPYKVKDGSGNVLDFPDETTWKRYVAGGGKLSRDDWRRSNVDQFVERLYRAIKAEKRVVKFGISPFGIWRPGNPPQIRGFDAYQEIYCDSRKWLENGWCDYISPQLYWSVQSVGQSYPVLLKWWSEHNPMGRHLWPGNFTSRVSDGTSNWRAKEIVDQVQATRAQAGATGNIHFSMIAFLDNRGGILDTLARGVYAQPALVPPSPWLDAMRPDKPGVTLKRNGGFDVEMRWQAGSPQRVFVWVVQTLRNGTWTTQVLPGQTSSVMLSVALTAVAVSAVDRIGNQSAPAIVQVSGDAER